MKFLLKLMERLMNGQKRRRSDAFDTFINKSTVFEKHTCVYGCDGWCVGECTPCNKVHSISYALIDFVV